MSGFGDTFTKNSESEDLLNYDDTAAYYFGATVLACIILPWTWSWVRFAIWGDREDRFPKLTKLNSRIRYCRNGLQEKNVDRIEIFERRKQAANKRWQAYKLTLLGILWMMWLYCLSGLAGDDSANAVKRFDPHKILSSEDKAIDSSSTEGDIKKAYRDAAKKWHPDKNPDDPLASAKFLEIKKAYDALTNESARANYEKYGNPDGPQTTKVGIGLPRFLLEKKNHLMILGFFFVLLLIAVPTAFIINYQRGKNYAANGVLVETLQFLGHYVDEMTRANDCIELFAASAESREMKMRSTDEQDMKPIKEAIGPLKLRWADKVPIIGRNTYLLHAHFRRLHHLLTPDLQHDLDTLLRWAEKVTASMLEIASMREWLSTVEGVIEFRRMLVQAVESSSTGAASLLQIPHFTSTTTQDSNNSVNDLDEYLKKDPQERRKVAPMTKEQSLDADAFASYVGGYKVEGKAEVEGEPSICKDDVVTVTISVTRNHLKEDVIDEETDGVLEKGEAQGFIHAPLFPELKNEEFYVWLTDGPSTMFSRVICHDKLRGPERVLTEKLRFQAERQGRNNYFLHVFNDSYVGLDTVVPVSFDVLSLDEAARSIYVHPEDEQLDLHPTLFQQFVGELYAKDEDDDSDDGEDDDAANKKKKKKNGSSDDAEATKDGSDSGSGSDDGGDSGSDDSDGDDSDGSSSGSATEAPDSE